MTEIPILPTISGLPAAATPTYMPSEVVSRVARSQNEMDFLSSQVRSAVESLGNGYVTMQPSQTKISSLGIRDALREFANAIAGDASPTPEALARTAHKTAQVAPRNR